MTDFTLRELERRFRTSGSVEDEAAWLRARIHAGELDADRMRLLAYLGRAVPIPGAYVPPQPRNADELGGWVHGLPHFERARHFPWSVEIYWRVGTALSRVLPAGEVSAARAAASLMDQWVTDPAEALAAELVALQDRLGSQVPGLAILPAARRQRRLLGGLVLAMAPARWPTIPVNAMPSQATEFLAEELGVSLVHGALLDELVPWALGYSDPVRERVEARKRETARE